MHGTFAQMDLFMDFEASLMNSIPKKTIIETIATAVKSAFEPNCNCIAQAKNEFTVSDRRRRRLMKGIATDAEAESIIWRASDIAADKARRGKRRRLNLRWNHEEI